MRLHFKLHLFILLNFLVLGAVKEACSQDSTWVKTTQLDGIVIYGLRSQEFITGSHQQNFDSALKESPADDFVKILQRNSAIYIKEYGNQMLSTISIRGTGPGHTSTLWNGMSVSSPTLGQFDFSQAPSIITDELLVHYGGSSALFGNESIGGSVLMQSNSQWKNIPSILLYQDVGSFDSYNTRAMVRVNSNKLESATKAYFSTTKNNFPYQNILLSNAPTEYQENAESSQEGFVQDLYWRPKSGRQISLHTWYHHSNRHIQPSMANPDAEDTQEDRNLRIQGAWKTSGRVGYANVKLGYMHDNMLYNRSITTESDQYVLQTNVGKDLTTKLTTNVGGAINHIRVRTDNYNNEVWENRWDVYAWVKYNPSHLWSLSTNIRSAGATDFSAPISPSLGSDLILGQNESFKITWKALSGMNYRIPTLNDRFWNPGGNADLNPERSLNLETGFQFDRSGIFSNNTGNFTVYRMWIEDWILWLPEGSFWSPRNIREVESTGMELMVTGTYLFGKTTASWNASWAYTQSTNQTELDQYDRSKGKQLPYIPFHNILLALKVNPSSWHSGITANFTGERFTSTDNADSLDPFWLVDIYAGYQFRTISLDFRINNAMNTIYFHLPYRPLPGRNYRISITLNINN